MKLQVSNKFVKYLMTYEINSERIQGIRTTTMPKAIA
jgi:hypothetical protein